jgi:hypothetical protein
MERLLAALRGQLGPTDRIIILDGTHGPPPNSAAAVGGGAVEHVRAAGESAFHLRSLVSAMADREITVLFEEHAIPGPRFVADVRRRFAEDSDLVAFKILGRNDTSTDPWSWANFFMAFSDCLHPAREMPKAMLSTSAALRTAALRSTSPTLGAWETQVMPGFNREPHKVAYSNDVWIDHIDPCNMKVALVGNFRNQRSLAALRVAQGHRRGKLSVRAFKDLAVRRPGQIGQALVGRDEYRHFVANRWKVTLVCWASACGAVVGAWFGPGAAMRKMH